MTRVALSIVVTPVALLALLVLSVRALDAAPGPFSYDALAGTGPLFILLTYLFMAVFSVPLAALLPWHRWLSPLHLAGCGAIVGSHAYAAMIWPTLSDDKLHMHFRLARLPECYPFFLLGAIGGVVFWLLGVFRNPILSSRRGLPASSPSAA